MAAPNLVARGWVGHDDLSAQATEVHSTDNCFVFDKNAGKSMEASRILGVLSSASQSNDWGPGPAVGVTRVSGLHILSFRGQLQVLVLTGADCRYSDGGQAKQHRLGPSAGMLAVEGTLVVSVHYVAAG